MLRPSNQADPVTVVLFLVGALKFGFGFTLGVGMVAAAIITPIKYWRNK